MLGSEVSGIYCEESYVITVLCDVKKLTFVVRADHHSGYKVKPLITDVKEIIGLKYPLQKDGNESEGK
jgi:hypothetical protein